MIAHSTLRVGLAPVVLTPFVDDEGVVGLTWTLAAATQGLARLLIANRVFAREQVFCSPSGILVGDWWPEPECEPPSRYDDFLLSELVTAPNSPLAAIPMPDALNVCVVPTTLFPDDASLDWYQTADDDTRILTLVRLRLDKIILPDVWFRLVRATAHSILRAVDGPGECDIAECICAPPRIGGDKALIPPYLLCGICRKRLRGNHVETISDLAEWVATNAEVTLDKVGKQRTERVRSLVTAGSRSLRLNNMVLLAHAERAKVGPDKDEFRTFAHTVEDDGTSGPFLRDLADHDLKPIQAVRGILRGLTEKLCDSSIQKAVVALDTLTPFADSVLHMTTKRGRDHAYHMAAVALFLQFLIDSGLPRPTPRQTVANAACASSGLSYEELCLATWFAAVFHDIGYPFSQFMQVRRLTDTGVVGGSEQVPFKEIMRQVIAALGATVGGDGSGGEVHTHLTETLASLLSSAASPDTVKRVHDLVKGVSFDEWTMTPSVFRELLPESGLTEPKSVAVLLDHGMVSAIICVVSLAKSGLSALAEPVPPSWLKHAIQAIALHNLELRHYPKAAESMAGCPVLFEGENAKRFSFADSPVTFLLRLVDKLHCWERLVRGRDALVQEMDHVELHNLVWLLTEDPQWTAPPLVELTYVSAEALDATDWQHSLVQKETLKYFRELPLSPAMWSVKETPETEYMSFSLTLPAIDPGKQQI
ncbi:hypothetical protein LLH23_15060 [bacterium]|nr:hypothetical protein [bacterium]